MKKLFAIFFVIMFSVSFSFSKAELKPGDTAPGFRLQNVDGKYVALADYKDAKGVVLIFTCNHCPFAVAYEDRILELDKKYRDKGYPVVAINPNDPAVVPQDSYEKMKERANEKGFTFPYLFDRGQTVYPKYGATRTPHVFFLKNEGDYFKVVYVGTIDDNARNSEKVEEKYLENAILAVMKGEKPSPDVTLAIGCSIKRKGL